MVDEGVIKSIVLNPQIQQIQQLAFEHLKLGQSKDGRQLGDYRYSEHGFESRHCSVAMLRDGLARTGCC